MLISKKTQCTKNYWAGALTAVLYNYFHSPKNKLPTLVDCISNPLHLQVIFGNYYQRAKLSKTTNHYILIYERFTFQIGQKDSSGSIEDFMIGFGKYRNSPKIEQSDLDYLKSIGFDIG